MNCAYLDNARISELSVISLYNPSFLYGINCFEGIRGYWNENKSKIFFFDLDEHLTRLYNSAYFLGFNVKITKYDLKEQLEKIILNENVREDVYIRITFFINQDTNWADVDNISTLVSLRSMKSELGYSKPTTLAVSSFSRISSTTMPPSVKAGANYLNSRYALLESKSKGFDGALFLNSHDFVSESTGSCIFFIKNNILFTPSIDCDILVGITRNRIIEICKKLQIEVREERIPLPTIYSYESSFLAGTMIEIKPVLKIERKEFDTLHPLLLQIINSLKQYIHGLEF